MLTDEKQGIIKVKPMNITDVPDFLRICEENFILGWKAETILFYLNKRSSCICASAELNKKKVGFIICETLFEKGKGTIQILNIIVEVSMQRRGVGTKLLEAVKKELSGDINKIIITIDERSLDAQLFLHKGNGFNCVKFIGENRELYKFQYPPFVE